MAFSPTTYAAVKEGARAAAMVRRFTIDAVAGRRAATARGLDNGIRMLNELREAGADHAVLADIAGWLHNAVSDLAGDMAKDLDKAGLSQDGARVDRSELEAIMRQIDRPALALAAE